MRKLVLAAALLVSPPALAEIDEITVCTESSKLAAMIMQIRQHGNSSMSDIYSRIRGNEIAEAMVRDAWNVPRRNYHANREQEISKFSDNVFRICLESFDEKN